MFLIWSLRLFLAFCSSSSSDEFLIKRFETEFNEYFINELSCYISENDEVMPLLDFPETFYEQLRSQSSLIVDDISIIAAKHIFSIQEQESCVVPSEFSVWDEVRNRILIFCGEFEKSYKDKDLHDITENAPKVIRQLIFPVATDFHSFYLANDILAEGQSSTSGHRMQEKWAWRHNTFVQISNLGLSFMRKCRRMGLIQLFSDFVHFTNMLKQSIFYCAEHIENLQLDGPLLFITQCYDCYFTVRYYPLEKFHNGPSSRDGFIKQFNDKVEDYWMKVIEDTEAMDIERPVNTNPDWQVMSERILNCKDVFNGVEDESLFVVSATLILRKIQKQFINNHAENIKFNVDDLISFVGHQFKHLFDYYGQMQGFQPLLIKFKSRILSIFDDFFAKDENIGQKLERFGLKQQSGPKSNRECFTFDNSCNISKAKEMIKQILDKFHAASNILPERWSRNQIFESNDEISQFFNNEILFFSAKIDSIRLKFL